MALSRLVANHNLSTVAYGPPQVTYHPEVIYQIIRSHPLTRPFDPAIVHCLADGPSGYILDLDVANGIAQALKTIFTEIHIAADPDSGPIKGAIASVITPIKIASRLFDDAKLPIPAILDIYPSFCANPLLVPNTLPEIQKVYSAAQDIGLQGLEWIAKARLVCATEENQFGWHWTNLDRERSLLLQGPVAFNAFVEAPGKLIVQNNVRDTILHPRASNWAHQHPRYNPHDPAINAILASSKIPPPIYNIGCAYNSTDSVNHDLTDSDISTLMELLGDLESDDELDVMKSGDCEIKEED